MRVTSDNGKLFLFFLLSVSLSLSLLPSFFVIFRHTHTYTRVQKWEGITGEGRQRQADRPTQSRTPSLDGYVPRVHSLAI